MDDLENSMLYETPEPEPEMDGDALYDDMRQQEIDDRAHLRSRVTGAIQQLVKHQSFDQQSLVSLLKDVNRELRK